MSEYSDQQSSVLERYKLNIAELEKRVLAEEKSLRDKDDTIKKNEAKINEINYEKEKSELKAIELH